MKRYLLDTNIYISAILFGGKPQQIINLARNGKIEIVISEYILWEIRRVLNDKFKIPTSRLNTIEHDILNLVQLVIVRSLVDIIKSDPADNNILACAVDGHVNGIVTGDNHLLKLEKYNNIPIITPHGFLRGGE